MNIFRHININLIHFARKFMIRSITFVFMEVKTIPIGGLNISQSKQGVQDGMLGDMVNLRSKNGHLKIVNAKNLALAGTYTTISSGNTIYHHPITPNDTFIVFSGTSVNYVNTSNSVTLMTLGTGEVLWDIIGFDKSLIITTNHNKYIFYYDDAVTLPTNPYTLIPDLDEINIYPTANANYETYNMETGYRVGDVAESDLDSWENTKSWYLISRDQENERGLWQGHCLVRVVYKLFDGSYLRGSRPMYVQLGNNLASGAWDMNYAKVTNPSGSILWKLYWKASTLRITKGVVSTTLYDHYRSIISSVEIFITPPMDGYQPLGGYPAGSSGTAVSITDLDTIKNTPNFYNVFSIPLDDYVNKTEWGIVLPPLSALQAREIMPIDELTYDKELGKISKVYNGRVHVGDITSMLSNEIDPFLKLNALGFLSTVPYQQFTGYSYKEVFRDSIKCVYYLDTNEGIKITTYDPEVWVYQKTSNPDKLILNPYLFYPDSRAFKLEIYYDIGGGWNLWKTYDLDPHVVYNFSQYQHTPYRSGTINVIYYQFIDTPAGGSAKTPPSDNQYISQPNRMQVSNLNNPLVYPPELSYRFGQPDNVIMAIDTVIFEMSTSQFGQFPLYIFTTEGIFTISQGSGSLLYSNVVKSSNAVITDNITLPVKDGILFKTKDGLSIIQGKTSAQISDLLIGENWDTLNSTISNTNKNAVNFRTYLATALFSYDFENNEIWVLNKSYNYSYQYQIKEGIWRKSSNIYDSFLRHNEVFIAFNSADNKFYDISDESNYVASNTPILLKTRPIKLSGPDIFKKIFKTLLKSKSGNQVNLTLKVFGSNDLENWKLLRTNAINTASFISDIPLGRLNASAKYYVFTLEGTISTEIEVDSLVIQYENKYTKKIR